MAMNPYYVAYAKAQGRSPDKQLAYDESVYLGGIMVGYIQWISTKKKEFYVVSPESFFDGKPDRIADYDKWGQFLTGPEE